MKYLLSIVFIFLQSIAFASSFIAGKDYQVIGDTAVHTRQPVQVIEFFSYACPWCYKMQKPLHDFIKKQGARVHFEQVPAWTEKYWHVHAKAYYAAKNLGKSKALGKKLFIAIQVRKRQLNSPEAMVNFFIENGVDKEVAEKAFFHNPILEAQMKKGKESMIKYQIRGVPTVVVGGRYKVDLANAKGFDRFIAIISFLIGKAEASE